MIGYKIESYTDMCYNLGSSSLYLLQLFELLTPTANPNP